MARRPNFSTTATRSSRRCSPPGTYTNLTGNTALAWGLIAASTLGQIPVLLGSYPITPASDILHELSRHKNFGIRTLQAEDEIAGVGAALGAAFGGHLGVTTTSGPGMALKAETVGLAVSLELPLVVIDIQRGGPSTGLPTKTEAADLLMAMYGRHGESPLPIVASYSPGHCFFAAIEACRIALKYRTPVVLLSDGYLANGAEPFRIPDVDSLPDLSAEFAFTTEPNHADADGTPIFWPYKRDPETLARPWAIPGTPGVMHRIGGLEKEDGSGDISYDPDNHERMVRLRAAKVAGIAKDIPGVKLSGDVDDAEVLVLGWGSTWGAIDGAMNRVRRRGRRVAHAHLVHLNPFPPDLGDVLGRYPKVLVPEMNLGQLVEDGAGRVPGRRPVDRQGQGHPVHRRRARAGHPRRAGRPGHDRHHRAAATTKKDWSSDQEVRWCPGCGDYSILTALQLLMPDLGVRREDTVFVSGIGCAARLAVLHEHLRVARHPRAGPRHRHRSGDGPTRSAHLGHLRRRRRPLDRRQPPHPRLAAQREPHDRDVQQPDLRAHQGPVLTDQRGGQGHQVDAVRFARPAVQRGQPGPRGRGHLRGPHP